VLITRSNKAVDPSRIYSDLRGVARASLNSNRGGKHQETWYIILSVQLGDILSVIQLTDWTDLKNINIIEYSCLVFRSLIYKHTYHSGFIPEGLADASQILLREAHVLPKLLS
jgi:hypothetical protein